MDLIRENCSGCINVQVRVQSVISKSSSSSFLLQSHVLVLLDTYCIISCATEPLVQDVQESQHHPAASILCFLLKDCRGPLLFPATFSGHALLVFTNSGPRFCIQILYGTSHPSPLLICLSSPASPSKSVSTHPSALNPLI